MIPSWFHEAYPKSPKHGFLVKKKLHVQNVRIGRFELQIVSSHHFPHRFRDYRYFRQKKNLSSWKPKKNSNFASSVENTHTKKALVLVSKNEGIAILSVSLSVNFDLLQVVGKNGDLPW